MMMISVEKLVHQMVGPLENIHRLMEDKLSAGYDGLSCRSFILHRNQWKRLVVDYSRIVEEIKGELMRTLETPMANLQSLYSAMKAAESSLEECIVPHMWRTDDPFSQPRATTQRCALTGVRDDSDHKDEKEEEMRILMVGERRRWASDLARELVGRCWDEVENCWKYRDPAGYVSFVIHVIDDDEPANVNAFLEQNGTPVHAIWYIGGYLDFPPQLEFLVEDKKLLFVSTDQHRGLHLVDPNHSSFRWRISNSFLPRLNFSELDLTTLMEMTMALMKRKLPSRCRAGHSYRRDRPFLDYYFHTCALHLSEEERMNVRVWLVRDALKHVLSPEIFDQHMDDLHIISTALKHTFIMKQHDSLLLTQQPTMTSSSIMERDEDVASAMRFLDSEFMHEIDRNNSQFLLRRLRHHHHHNLSVEDAKVSSLEHTYIDAAQFSRKCSSSSSTGTIAETQHSTIKSMSWISPRHRVAVKKGRNILPNEIAIQASVRHPNLLPLLCWTSKMEEQIGNRTMSYRLVMELMDCDLDQWIKDTWGSGQHSNIPLHVCVDVMLQIAKGMEYLHSLNIMHRDLKPPNILVHLQDSSFDHSSLLKVKIADFGTSKFDGPAGIHTNKVGTGFYRAPEVMEEGEHGVYGKKADVYSFAMVCYHILTGEEPFRSEQGGDMVSRALLRQKIRKEGLRPKFRRLVAPGAALKDMVEQCWHREVSRRPEFVQIVEFLRFVKICALQLPNSQGQGEGEEGGLSNEGEGGVTHSRPDIVATLETKDLFCRLSGRASSNTDTR